VKPPTSCTYQKKFLSSIPKFHRSPADATCWRVARVFG
jgi:hypothetical protein